MRPKELFYECFKSLVPNTSLTYCYIQDGCVRFRCEVYSTASSDSLRESYTDFKNKLQLEGYFSFEDKSQSVLNQNEKACKAFLKEGDITTPHVRNYLKNFCQKN